MLQYKMSVSSVHCNGGTQANTRCTKMCGNLITKSVKMKQVVAHVLKQLGIVLIEVSCGVIY